MSLSSHYSTGDYGPDQDTDIFYAPFVARAELGPWMLKLVLPYIIVSGGGVEGPAGPVAGSGGTHDGLGDIVAEVSYTFWFAQRWAPILEIGSRVKFPTADEDEGLGTGEFDVTPEIELAGILGRWTPFASAGYRVLGDSQDSTYYDGFVVTAGTTVRVTERLEAGGFLYWRQASSEVTLPRDGPPPARPRTGRADDPFEIIPYLRWTLSSSWLVDFYVSAGLSDGSPDVGTGLTLRYRISLDD
ncbi:MAG TPA: transporter [Candidatus Binatia bacterium]|nr:transporter [Candidatus Binatia bacterium]